MSSKSPDDKMDRRVSETSSNGDAAEELKTYTVKDGDNLNKIAVMHDTSASKIAQINKMSSSRLVFPGQILKIPAPDPPKPKPPEPKIDEDVVDLDNNFVRINVKHITDDKGIVDGTILLTHKVVMFDPYAHDPLVARQENSTDNYQVILPIKYVINGVLLHEYKQMNSDQDETLIITKEQLEQLIQQQEADSDAQKEANNSSRNSKNDEEKENEIENQQTTQVPKKGMFLKVSFTPWQSQMLWFFWYFTRLPQFLKHLWKYFSKK